MPRILEDRGDRVLIEQDDGSIIEVLKDSINRVQPDFLANNVATGPPGLTEPPAQAPGLTVPLPLPGPVDEFADDLTPPDEFADDLTPPVSVPGEEGADQLIAPDFAQGAPALQPTPITGVPAGISQLPSEQRIGAGQELVARGARRRLEGAELGVEAARQRSEAEVQALQEQQERERQINEREQATRSAQQRELAVKISDLSADIDRLTATKIDGNRMWNDLGTGRTILAAVGAAVAGLGSALKGQGGQNPALGVINAAIDRDVKLQLADRANLAQGIQAKRGLLGLLRTQHSSELGQFEAARAASEKTVANQFRQSASRSRVPTAQQLLLDTAGQLDAQAAQSIERSGRADQAFDAQERFRRAQLRSQAAGRAAAAKRQQAGFDFAREQAELDRAHKVEVAQAKAAGQPEPGRPFLSTFTGKLLGRLPANLSAGEIDKVETTVLNLEETAKQLAILRRRMKQVGSIFKGTGRQFVQTAEGKALFALYSEYIRQKVRTFSGVTSRPDERKDIEESLQLDSFANALGGDVDAIWEDEAQRVARVATSWMIRKGQGQIDTQTFHDELLATGIPTETAFSTAELETGARTATTAKTALDQLGGLALQLDDNPSIVFRGPRFRQAVVDASRLIQEQGDATQKSELRRIRAQISRGIIKARPEAFELATSRFRGGFGARRFDPTDPRTFSREDRARIFRPLEPVKARPEQGPGL